MENIVNLNNRHHNKPIIIQHGACKIIIYPEGKIIFESNEIEFHSKNNHKINTPLLEINHS